jgi:anti-sigma factor RsiW
MRRLPIDDRLLVAYADGELDAATAAMVEAQLALEPALAGRLAMLRRTAGLLRDALSDGPYVELPPAVAERARALLARRRLALAGRWLAPMAAGLAGLLIGIGAMSLAQLDPGAREAPDSDSMSDSMTEQLREVAEYHLVFATEREHLVEIPAERAGELERWLGARVGLAFHVPDLSSRGLVFVGGRMLPVDGRPAAQLMYITRSGARVALCFTALAAGAPSRQVIVQDGVRLVGHREGGRLYVVAGPAGEPGLDGLARELPELLRRS